MTVQVILNLYANRCCAVRRSRWVDPRPSGLTALRGAVTKVSEGSGHRAKRFGTISREAGLFLVKRSTGFGNNARFLEVVI